MLFTFAAPVAADHHFGCIQPGTGGRFQLPEGSSVTISIVLCNRPTANVRIDWEKSGGNRENVTISPASHTFTIGSDYWAGNWHKWQGFTVTFAEDSFNDGNSTMWFRPLTTSDDARYSRGRTGCPSCGAGHGQRFAPIFSVKLIDNEGTTMGQNHPPQQQQQQQTQQPEPPPPAQPPEPEPQVQQPPPEPPEPNPPQQPPPQQREPQQQQAQLGTIRNLSVSATADTITVSWDPPSEGTVTKYIAHITPQNGDKGKTKRPNADKTSVTFKNLKSGVEYKVWVRALNDIQKGERTHHRVTTQ